MKASEIIADDCVQVDVIDAYQLSKGWESVVLEYFDGIAHYLKRRKTKETVVGYFSQIVSVKLYGLYLREIVVLKGSEVVVAEV